MSNRLEHKTAVITGGTTGLGFESAKRFIEEGAKVLITGRTEEKVNKALNYLGQNAHGFVADVCSLADTEKLVGYSTEIFGKDIDILFANAGIGNFGSLDSITEELYNEQFDVNVKGVFFTVQKFLPLLKRGSSVILTASAVNEKGAPMGSIYFATKAAVRSFARSMAAELGPLGIRVNALSPGIVRTKFQANTNIGEDKSEGFIEMVVNQAPLGREGKPLDMAHAAVFLGSDESVYMTAADLVVDGGWMNV